MEYLRYIILVGSLFFFLRKSHIDAHHKSFWNIRHSLTSKPRYASLPKMDVSIDTFSLWHPLYDFYVVLTTLAGSAQIILFLGMPKFSKKY
jgi:hypothetical protein